jgi:ribosomal protein S18 acetylase RimI-like enzyme
MSIRKALDKDIKSIYEIIFDPQINIYLLLELEQIDESRFKLFWDRIKNNTYVYEDEKVKGVITLREGVGRRAHINFIGPFAVNPVYQNQGIGTKLLEYVIKLSRLTNKEKIQLEVVEDAINAINLYKKFGFVIEGILKKNFKRNNTLLDTYIMSKFLQEDKK